MSDVPQPQPQPQPQPDLPAGPEAGAARILDRGYRSYDGPRTGTAGAIKSLVRHSIQRVLGFKRGGWAKVLPFATVFMAYVPAIVFVGITVLVPDVLVRVPDLLPTYGQYYFYVSAAIVIFAAFVAPELLCPDRRNGMLGLYLASPFTRNTYLVAKTAAVGIILAIVTLGPPVFMIVARTIAGSGPEDAKAVVTLLGQAALSGTMLGVLYTAISLAISSVTARKAAAAAAIILVVLGTAAVSDVLVSEADANEHFFLFNLLNMPFELVLRIYGEGSVIGPASALSTPVLILGYAGWVIPCAVLVWARYRRVEVTR